MAGASPVTGTAKTVVPARFDKDVLEDIHAWAKARDIDRSEAIRRLVELWPQGLGGQGEALAMKRNRGRPVMGNARKRFQSVLSLSTDRENFGTCVRISTASPRRRRRGSAHG